MPTNTVDVQTGHVELHTLPEGCYVSEPMYVPTGRPGEDGGYLLDLVYDGSRHVSTLLILNAEKIQEAIARVPLKHHVPHQFHGFFTDEVFI